MRDKDLVKMLVDLTPKQREALSSFVDSGNATKTCVTPAPHNQHPDKTPTERKKTPPK